MKERKELGLRLPMDLYERVKRTADAEHTTVTQFIVTALEKALSTPTTAGRLNSIEERLASVERIARRWIATEQNVRILANRLNQLEVLSHWNTGEAYPAIPDEEKKEQD